MYCELFALSLTLTGGRKDTMVPGRKCRGSAASYPPATVSKRQISTFNTRRGRNDDIIVAESVAVMRGPKGV